MRKVSDQYEKMSIFDNLGSPSEDGKAASSNPLADLFLKPEPEDRKPELKKDVLAAKKEAQEAEKRNDWEKMSRAQKLQHNTLDDVSPLRGDRSIRSSACGEINNDGGSGNMPGCQNQNSIFSTNALEKASQAMSSKEKIAIEKETIENTRQAKEQEYREAMNPSIDTYDLVGHPSTVSSTSSNEEIQDSSRDAPGWGVPAHSMSIFDNGDFSRLEPTAGEKMSEAREKTAQFGEEESLPSSDTDKVGFWYEITSSFDSGARSGSELLSEIPEMRSGIGGPFESEEEASRAAQYDEAFDQHSRINVVYVSREDAERDATVIDKYVDDSVHPDHLLASSSKEVQSNMVDNLLTAEDAKRVRSTRHQSTVGDLFERLSKHLTD